MRMLLLKKQNSRKIAGFLAALLIAASLTPALLEIPAVREAVNAPAYVYAGGNMNLKSAKSIAIANSEEIETLEMSVEAKQAAINSAVRSLKERERNMKTFRWSPLLSFKFPTKPDETEAFNFQFKPQQLQSELRTMKHKVDQKTLEIYEKVNTTYVTITQLQNSIAFNTKRLNAAEELLKKLPAQVALGKAKQADVDKAQKQVDTLKSSLATDQSKLEKAKKKLSGLIGIDVTKGYNFEDPFVGSNMKRSVIPSLVQYTLNRDHTYFEACQAESLAMINLSVNYSLIRSKYRAHIGRISGYIQQAMNGTKLNRRQFKKDYDTFLKEIDAKWQGKYRILFISFPKEWLKGSLDGIRYVQNEPYVLYESALDYLTALSEKKNTAKEIEDAVNEGYDNFMSAKKAYVQTREEAEKLSDQIVADEIKYIMGMMEKEEFENEKQEFEGLQNEMNEALATCSELAYNFDKTTCGGASQYFSAETLELGTASETAALPRQPQFLEGATYTIKSMVEDEAFLLSVYIPENFTDPKGERINVTDFELWCDDMQIGGRTRVGTDLKHLTLTVSGVDSVKIRLLNNGQVVTDCEIDPTVSYGPLNIMYGYEEQETRIKLGTYTLDEIMAEGRIRASFTIEPTVSAKFYKIKTKADGEYLYDDTFRDIEASFDYISAIRSDFAQLNIELYDANQELLYTGFFDTEKLEIYTRQ